MKEASLLVHVRDISNPHHEAQKRNVLHVLRQINTPESLLTSMIEVCNKADRLPEVDWMSWKKGAGAGAGAGGDNAPINLSALNGTNMDVLKDLVQQRLATSTASTQYDVLVPCEDDKLMSWLCAQGGMFVDDKADCKKDNDNISTDVVIRVSLDRANLNRCTAMFPNLRFRVKTQQGAATVVGPTPLSSSSMSSPLSSSSLLSPPSASSSSSSSSTPSSPPPSLHSPLSPIVAAAAAAVSASSVASNEGVEDDEEVVVVEGVAKV